jgi:hypothetical protein
MGTAVSTRRGASKASVRVGACSSEPSAGVLTAARGAPLRSTGQQSACPWCGNGHPDIVAASLITKRDRREERATSGTVERDM